MVYFIDSINVDELKNNWKFDVKGIIGIGEEGIK